MTGRQKILGIAVGAALAGGGLVWAANRDAKAPVASAGAADAVAAMAVRAYPNGAAAVVIVGATADGLAAESLANGLSAPLLVADSATALGPAAERALAQLSVPNTGQGAVQPYAPAAGKPMVYLVGSHQALSPQLARQLSQAGYRVVRIAAGSPGALVDKVRALVAPAIPARVAGFPAEWTAYAGGAAHNSAYPATAASLAWVKNGVRWNFPETAAVPLSAPFPDLAQLGERGAPVKMTQTLGNAVGVTAVDGVIYAESDDAHLYAVDARTGRRLWEAGPAVNALMGDPVVGPHLVYVTAGDTGFSFSQVLKYAASKGSHSLVRGLGYSAIYAYDRTTGRLVWRQDFRGNAMPTPVLWHGVVYEPTGGGNLWAFDAATGRRLWKTSLGGFDSMSSPAVWTDPATGRASILVGTSDANNLVSVDAATGRVLWKQPTGLNIFNTGMGDNSPAVDETRGVVVQDSVVDFNPSDKTVNLAVYAVNARTGAVLWATKLGRGAAPPAYKAGVAMIHNGTVYVGSPVTSSLYALDETTGKVLWQFHYPAAGPAGAGRGGAVYADGVLWTATGPSLYAFNPVTGRELGHFSPGGRFGIVNPVIVGGTMYVDNSYDWIQAVPLKRIDPGLRLPN